MRRNTLIAAAVLVVLAAVTAAAPQRADEPKAGAEPDFTGKVLVVSTKDPAHGAVLQKARVQKLGGRAFLVGEYVKRNDDDPWPEEIMWLALDDLQTIREFKSAEDVRKMYAAAGK
jgi:hypothetical protein